MAVRLGCDARVCRRSARSGRVSNGMANYSGHLAEVFVFCFFFQKALFIFAAQLALGSREKFCAKNRLN